ncbi:hypothetical protein CEK25_011739 [Fusarium fujikuroi]|nr:hypothetical protein CEK25_011739 [Fusarium fujikuroi]
MKQGHEPCGAISCKQRLTVWFWIWCKRQSSVLFLTDHIPYKSSGEDQDLNHLAIHSSALTNLKASAIPHPSKYQFWTLANIKQYHVQPQPAVPQNAQSHTAAFVKQHVTQQAMPLQTAHSYIAAFGTLSNMLLRHDSPQPSMTPPQLPGTSWSSIGHQTSHTRQFQPEAYSPKNAFGTPLDRPFDTPQFQLEEIQEEYLAQSLDSSLGSVSSDVAGIQEEYVAQHPDSPHVSVSSEALRIQEEDIAEEPRREENSAEGLLALRNSSMQEEHTRSLGYRG